MKTQLLNTFAVVFSLCLASFAVPLVLGGGPQNSTLEVLVYESIYSNADVAGAVLLSLIQCALQFAVFFVLLKPILLKTEQSRTPWAPVRVSFGLLPALVLAVFCLTPLIRLLSLAVSEPSTWAIFAAEDFITATKTSVLTSGLVTLCSFTLLCWVTARGFRPRLTSLPALSGVAVGLAGFLLFKTWHLHNIGIFALTLVWGHMSVIFLPVFRLCSPPLESLRLKFDRALQQMGADNWFSFKKVYSKLGMKTFVAGGVLAGCWSMGEFSVSSMMSPGAGTLPVYIHALLSSYRLEAAAGASIILLLLSMVTMSLFEVLAHGMG